MSVYEIFFKLLVLLFLFQGEYQQVNVTKEAKAVVQTVRQICSGNRWGSNFTINHIVDILKGSEVKKVKENNHDKLPLHGMSKAWSRNDCERLTHKLILSGYIGEEFVQSREGIAHSYVRLGHKGLAFLSNPAEQMNIEMRAAKQRMPAVASVAETEECDKELQSLQTQCYESLLEEVKEIARQKHVNYTNIINMVALRAMSRKMPESEEEMRRIPHITEANFVKYGQSLLEITQRFAANKLVLLSEREEAQESNETGDCDTTDDGGSWLQSVSAPEPSQGGSPYFGGGYGYKKRGRGGFRGRKATRGKRKRGTSRSTAATYSGNSGESFQIQTARQAQVRRKTAAAAVLQSARRGAAKLSLMGAPAPRRASIPIPNLRQL